MKNFFQYLLVLTFMGVNIAFAAPSISLTSSVEDIAVSTESGALQTISPEALSVLDAGSFLSPEILTGMLSMGGVVVLIPLLIFLFLTVANWKVYSKAGYPGWHSIVPILNIVTFVRFTGTAMLIGAMILLSFIPIVFPDLALVAPLVSILLSFGMFYKMAKSFRKGIGFTFGLFFLGLIFFPILAFNKNITYVGPGGKKL